MPKRFGLSQIIIFLLLFSLVYSMFNVKFWKQEGQVIKWDVLEYYGYLPSAFIYKDLSLKYTEKPTEDWGKRIWALTAPNGKKVFKMSMGMSFMYAPFFGLAHGYALLVGFKADGFSAPYKFALLMSSLFYLLIGLFYLRKVLLLLVNDLVTSMTLFAIVAGTNLWYYASFEAPLSHAYSFSLIAIFLRNVLKYYKNPSLVTAIAIGLLTGLISLIRPNNGLVVLLFIFYGISGIKTLNERMHFFLKYYVHIIMMILGTVLVWFPQMIYWHMQTGHWLYFSYAENGAFFFQNPQIINGLFSFRKGWFLYTPLMLVATLAIPLTWKYARSFTIPITLFVILNIYIVLSWWCWWYGGCFGQRAFIDSYAIMAIPLALLLKWIASQLFWRKIAIGSIVFLTFTMSIVHTTQYYYGAIHWDSMTREAYRESFGHIRPGPNFWQLIKAPDYDKALKGEKEY